jgi:hypothetical protein
MVSNPTTDKKSIEKNEKYFYTTNFNNIFKFWTNQNKLQSI